MDAKGNTPIHAAIGKAHLVDVATHASALIQESRASNTVGTYQSDWRRFTEWCETYLVGCSTHPKPLTLTPAVGLICQTAKSGLPALHFKQVL